MAPFDRPHTSSYWRSIETMVLSCIISEIKRLFTNIAIFHTSCIRRPRQALGDPCRNIPIAFGVEKTRMAFSTQYRRVTDGRTDILRWHSMSNT